MRRSLHLALTREGVKKSARKEKERVKPSLMVQIKTQNVGKLMLRQPK
ncbi:unnamed protein product [Tenebrio molitor]|jgi:hypothetical protein|nr:unnamed protein product [Tenebrio molitor]